MKRVGFLAVAALLAGLGVAPAAPAQQAMYRCGNTYQDKPCDDGQKGRPVGTTGAPKSAAAAAEQQKSAAIAKDLQRQRKAQDCMSLRYQLGGPRKVQENMLDYMRTQGCAEGPLVDAERRCAGAKSTAETAKACGEYAKAGPRAP